MPEVSVRVLLRKWLIQLLIYGLAAVCLGYISTYVVLRKQDKLVVDGTWTPNRLIWNRTPGEPGTFTGRKQGSLVEFFQLGWKLESIAHKAGAGYVAPLNFDVIYKDELSSAEARLRTQFFAGELADLASGYSGSFVSRYQGKENYVITARIRTEDWLKWKKEMEARPMSTMMNLEVTDDSLTWRFTMSLGEITVQNTSSELMIIYEDKMMVRF